MICLVQLQFSQRCCVAVTVLSMGIVQQHSSSTIQFIDIRNTNGGSANHLTALGISAWIRKHSTPHPEQETVQIVQCTVDQDMASHIAAAGIFCERIVQAQRLLQR